MTNPIATEALQITPLPSRLASYSGVSTDPLPANLTDRLGQWVKLGNAIHLANAISQANAAPTQPSPIPASALQGQLLQYRATLIRSIQQTKWPSELNDFQDFFKIYVNQQNKLEHRIAQLRAEARQALTESSKAMAKLAHLDRTLEELFLNQARTSLNRVPRLLPKRFQYWQQQSSNATLATHTKFCQELQQLLIIELDFRLQPIIGLMKAVEPHQTPSDTEEADTIEH